MKTQISAFCTEFSENLFPLAESLGDTVRLLEEVGEDSVADLCASLSNLRHRVEALVNKVQGQEAYVLLFGPLKSGKSTLLNAISASYVSEVTSLPAYPCMVNLKYGDPASYSVIRYSGKRDEVASPNELKELLEQSHRTLSERIRAIEDFGEAFDPSVHLPSAIRRVQVELPAENLRESGTVLVDTPGLYSKMKFGYDAMTQEFRDSAASAVFVVKTDNLFLEQVFDDFSDLLDQFSRVFVVVNVDSGKQDLCPDGTLSPSVESSDPEQILKAFESLTMSAPLRRAAESGRLHLYPVDLRSAAERRLQGNAGPAEPDSEDPDRFDRFLNDLLDYLNSADYLLEFMADTTRQFEGLALETMQACESEPAEAVRRARADVQHRIDDINGQHEVATRVRNEDWGALFGNVKEDERVARKEALENALGSFRERAEEAVAAWCSGDESLSALREQHLQPLVREGAAAFGKEIGGRLTRMGARPMLGLAVPDRTAGDMASAGLHLEAVGQKALGALPAAEPVTGEVELRFEDLPLKRGLVDRLLFRSTAALRRKLFGPPEAQTRAVSPRAKEKQLGPEGRAALMEEAAGECRRLLERVEEVEGEARMAALTEACTKGVESSLNARERGLTRDKKQAMSTLDKLDRLDAAFTKLEGTGADVLIAVRQLEEVHLPKKADEEETLDHPGIACMPHPGGTDTPETVTDDAGAGDDEAVKDVAPLPALED